MMTILLIDDDSDFRTGLAANLRDDGHEVREFASPAELPALETLGDIDAVISDYQMGGRDGLGLADQFHHLHPATPFIMVTAYWSQYLATEAGRRKFIVLQRKPVDYEDLLSLVQRALKIRGRMGTA
jgi:DNA-binding NtrC family response regulator